MNIFVQPKGPVRQKGEQRGTLDISSCGYVLDFAGGRHTHVKSGCYCLKTRFLVVTRSTNRDYILQWRLKELKQEFPN